MKTIQILVVMIAIMLVGSVAFAGGKDNSKKKSFKVPATEFVVIDSITVVYDGQENFSLNAFRKENRREFSFWDKEINDQNFPAAIKPGDKVMIVIAEEKNGKVFTTAEAENFLASQNAVAPNIAWLAIAQKQYGKDVWQKANTVCFGSFIIHKSGVTLIPCVTADGNISLFAREYPSNNESIDQIAFIKK